MHIGTAITAANGLLGLDARTTYYLISNRANRAEVVLAWWSPTWTPHLTLVERTRFEASLVNGALTHAPAHTLPPWLAAYEGVDPDALEAKRVAPKKSLRQRCQDRLDHIVDLLDAEAEIFMAADPQARLEAFIKPKTPHQHPTRLARWFIAYVLSGRNFWSLLPNFRNIGAWERDKAAYAKTKLGRPHAKKGRLHGHSAIPLRQRIGDAYARFARVGLSMAEIYRRAVTEVFGCRTRKDERGYFEFYHSQGAAFPSLGQFRYAVAKVYGTRRVRDSRLGDGRARNAQSVSAGRFSEACANLYEHVETDGYSIPERPKQLIGEQADLPLVVTRLVDGASAFVTGIGFAYGAENGDGYRSMLFCAAIPKSYFGRIMGLTITDEEWPSQGLAAHLISDRGPAARGDISGDGSEEPAIREITPSWTGQSKATVESSHPRTMQQTGQPSYLVSDLNVIEMARREVLRVIADNTTSDASARMTISMVADGCGGTPLHLWNYLDARGRNNAVPITIERAVRAFLVPVTLTLNRDGLWLNQLRYTSAALKAEALEDSLALGQSMELPGFVYPMAVRMAWIELKGRLTEIEAQLPLRDDSEQLYLPLSESIAHAAALAKVRSTLKEQAPAALAHVANAFEEQAGKKWNAGKRHTGRPKARRATHAPGSMLRHRRK